MKEQQKIIQDTLRLIKAATPLKPISIQFSDSGTFAPSSPLPVHKGEGIQ